MLQSMGSQRVKHNGVIEQPSPSGFDKRKTKEGVVAVYQPLFQMSLHNAKVTGSLPNLRD